MEEETSEEATVSTKDAFKQTKGPMWQTQETTATPALIVDKSATLLGTVLAAEQPGQVSLNGTIMKVPRTANPLSPIDPKVVSATYDPKWPQ